MEQLRKFFKSIDQLFNKLKVNDTYKSFFVNPITYVTGAVLLALFNIVTFIVSGKGWGVTGAFAYWGAWVIRLFGGSVDKWTFFSSASAQKALDAGFFNHSVSVRNLGIILGALLVSLLASQFKFKKIKSKKQVFGAILGGLLMGYGARVASGCNIGALFTGISALSLSGWVFAIFIFIGAIFGSKLLVKFFM